MMRFLSGLPVPVFRPSSVPFDFFFTSSCLVFFWPLLQFLTLLSPQPPLFPPGVTTSTDYYSSTQLAFVVLTTSHHHPFNTAPTPLLVSDDTSRSLPQEDTACSGLGYVGRVSVDSSVHITLCHVSVDMLSGTII